MAPRRRPLLIPGPNYARILFAVLCTAGATTAILAALGWELRFTLALAPLRELRDAPYSWVHADSGFLTGARGEGTTLVVDRWDLATRAPAKPIESWRIDIGGARSAWAVHADKRLAAWIARGQLSVRPLGAADAPATRTAVPDIPVMAIGFVPDGRVAALFSDGSARAWRPYDLSVAAKGTLAVMPGDVVAFEDGAFSVWSPRKNKFAIYDVESWEPRPKDATTVRPGATPVLMQSGHVAQLAKNGVWFRDEFYQAPGPVRSVAIARIDSVIATGDFEGVHLLSLDQAPSRMVGSSPRSSIGLHQGRVVLLGPRGTTVYDVRGFELMTGRGRFLVYAAAALLGVLALYLLALFFRLGGKLAFHLYYRVPPGSNSGFVRGSSDIPEDLLDGLKAGAVLWAGPGLSAQSGYPTWNEMLAQLRDAATREKWFGREAMERIDGAWRAGNDQLLEEVVRGMSARRARMVEFVCNVYGLPAQLSKSHYALYAIPFRACITTNYDNLLERLSSDWAARLYTAKSEGYVRAAAHSTFFLWKLNGDLRNHDTILLCPSELHDAARKCPRLPQTLHSMFEAHSFLFVGVSPERLLADLRSLDFPISGPNSHHARHWLVAGVSGRQWTSAARKLDEMYGVRLLPFRASEVDAELPLWLGRLSKEVQGVLQTT